MFDGKLTLRQKAKLPLLFFERWFDLLGYRQGSQTTTWPEQGYWNGPFDYKVWKKDA